MKLLTITGWKFVLFLVAAAVLGYFVASGINLNIFPADPNAPERVHRI